MGRINKKTRQRRDALREFNERRTHQKLMREKKLQVNELTVQDDLGTNVDMDFTDSENCMQVEPMDSSSLSLERKDIGIQVTPITKRKLAPPDMQKQTINGKSGRRIISISSLDAALREMSFHFSVCGKGPMFRQSEQKRGWHVNIIYKCGCGKEFSVSSDGDNDTLPVNDAVAWGSTQSAVGFKATTQLFATLDIPTPSFKTFQNSQDKFHEMLLPALYQEMKNWAVVEADLAREAGDIVTINEVEYAAITVIVDGGWCKRSYRHSFSSNCGVAVIIGARTKKILYMDTKIKTCAVCDRKRESTEVPPHICYKNYTGTPTGMESSIILQGFKESMAAYGLVYWKFIGDGDSSVHAKVLNAYPNIQVEKVECCNHVVRNYTTKLIDISMGKANGKENLCISLEERRLFNPTIHRFRTGLVQAIAYHHKNNSNWTDLRDDILNIRYHIFGQHDNCKSYFCNGPKEKEQNRVESISKTSLWKALEQALDRPASLSPSLIKKESSNCAESFMSVACKYVEGKRKNYGQKYLYRLRMAAAVFSYNGTSFWADKALELIQGKTAGPFWQVKSKEALSERSMTKKYRVKRPLKVPQLGPACIEYGDNPQRPDLADEVLQLKILEKKSSLQVTSRQAIDIEAATILQSESDEWIRQRRERITASLAGPIYSLGSGTDNTSTLNTFFDRRKKSAAMIAAMDYGKANESRAVAKYETVQGMPSGSVKRAGLVIYQKNGIFGASPDGYVGLDGILEVKCPHSLFLKKKCPVDWPTISKCSSLRMDENGKLYLKRTHSHYFQIIMQVYITGRLWCDYFVWSEHGYFLERIVRSAETDALWERMQIKLERFWMEDISPELVDSRFDRGYTEYRCTNTRLAGRKRKAAKRKGGAEK